MLIYTALLGILLLLSSVMCSINTKKGLEIRKRIQKGSRQDDRPLDLVVLETATISASCPKCGANLNLAEIEPDRIFKCIYCGAEGIIEWPLDDVDTPEEE